MVISTNNILLIILFPMFKPIAKTIPPIWISKAGDNLIKKCGKA
jgi:hypothetical protein